MMRRQFTGCVAFLLMMSCSSDGVDAPNWYGPDAPIYVRRPIGLCEWSRETRWMAIGSVASWSYPSRVVATPEVPDLASTEVTDAVLKIDEEIVGPVPTDVFIFNKVSNKGRAFSGSLRTERNEPQQGLMFFSLRGGRPYFEGLIFKAENGVFAFDTEGLEKERVAASELTRTINAYRSDRSSACSTGPDTSPSPTHVSDGGP